MPDDRQPPVNDQIALYILQERLNELKDQYARQQDQNMSLFQQLTDTQRILSERLLIVETNSEHVSNALIKLQKDSSLQTKLLTGILLSLFGALASVAVKALVH